MRFLALNEVLALHRLIIQQSGGTLGIINLKALESALAQPRLTFGETDLYPSIAEKASILGYSLIKNHPFLDGNKRIGHAAMEVFLLLNGLEIQATVDEQETMVMQVASGKIAREEFTIWLQDHLPGKEN